MKYERLTNGLIESTQKGRMIVACKYELSDCNDSCLYGGYKCRWVEKALYRLAELEDKIEHGTLIELPCKVGDTVYRVRKKPYGTVLERFVVSITLCLNYKGQFEWRLFTTTEDTLGKTVFLTREDAEKRLKELQE